MDAGAERLGGAAEVGRVSFSGTVLLRDKGPAINGTARVNRTKLTLATEGAIRDGKPFIFVGVSSDLLDLGDVQRAVQVYRVSSVTDTKDVEVDMDDAFVAKSRLELDLHIRKIRGSKLTFKTSGREEVTKMASPISIP